MLEFSRRELQFKLDDVEYNIKFPSVKQMSSYSKAYAESADKFDSVIEFLVELGLEKEMCENLELDHLNKIIKVLTEEKK